MWLPRDSLAARHPPDEPVFRAPRGRTPALGSGQGVYRRDRATQMLSLGNTCAPVPRPVSHMHAAAAAAVKLKCDTNTGRGTGAQVLRM